VPATSQSNEQEDKHVATTDKTNILERLAEGITQLTSSERWQEWLTMQSRFHSYSFNNTLLILGQKPEASRVAGFNAWRKLDRFVRKGENGIWILAPMVYKSDAGDEVTTADEPTKVIRGFKAVPVFDVSQTDGAEIPEVCIRLEGEDEAGLFGRLSRVAASIGFSVEDADDLAGANGVCTHDDRRIQVLASNSPAQRVKTLAHELCHAMLHAPGEGRPESRAVLELEAESVAFVVCAAIGITSDDYSFGYVATWCGGDDEALAAIKESGARIQRTADQVISALDRVELAGVV
jgi:antirestriction protein ArdC